MNTIMTRARDLYRTGSGNAAAEIDAPISHFEVSARRLSATTPVKFTGEMGEIRTLEVDNVASPVHSVAIFPMNLGRIGFRLWDMRDWRFYAECLIQPDSTPAGAVFQPKAREQMTIGSTREINMTWNGRLKRWCFVTSASQVERTPLDIVATGRNFPASANWLFQGLRLLPFKPR